MATHDFERVEDIIDRAIVLRQARLAPFPAARTLRERYRAASSSRA